jgi:DNA (cytosine-5)-methyltransferase 1
MTDTVSFGSLFSGAGGFDLGLERASWNGIGTSCKFQVEWDKHCQQVLQHHWPEVPKWENVQDVNGADLPPVEVIAWGSPCQDLSNAGARAGLQGEKSSMFFEGIRIIKEMREATNGIYPTVSIWENVAGALTSGGGEDFATVIREMADAGCSHIEWRVLDAQWFGVPQRRRRVFVIAVWDNPTSIRSGQQILSDAQRSECNLAQGGEQRKTDSGESFVLDSGNSQSEPLTIDATRMNHVRVHGDGFTRTLPARMGTGGNNVPFLVQDNQTIVRKLTEIECERLMGWNDDHTRFRADGKETSSSQRYKMCGNGVVAPVATWIGEKVIETIRTKKELPV